MFKLYLLNVLLESDYSHAHKEAQKNAALPVEKGGLGLHKNNTAMDRANAMGFTTKAYHSTDKSFDNFDIEKSSNGAAFGKGVYVTYNKDKVSGWIKNKEGSMVLPLLVKRDNVLKMEPLSSESASKLSNYLGRNIEEKSPVPYTSLERKGNGHVSIGASNAGFSGVDHTGIGTDNLNTVFTDMRHIRSINAAFDPFKKDSSDLLA